jgi:oligopeptide/dipeptide ABC transporter ATP-binding protein
VTPLLEVEDLHVRFPTVDGQLHAVQGLSFTIERGRTLAIVGESGSGKSASVHALLGLAPGARVSGAARFEGRDLLTMEPVALRGLRGAQISIVFQDPLSSLHPLHRVGWQIGEMIRIHDPRVSRSAAKARAIELLGVVGIGDPRRRAAEFPHQLSGGTRQRALIAMAMALRPKLLIADEPTSSLDVIVQAQVLDVLEQMRQDFGTALLVITHDLRVVSAIAERVLVMYAGRAMEVGSRDALLGTPHHPYTRALMDAVPDAARTGRPLRPIEGQPPSMLDVLAGCPFHLRCRSVHERCWNERPPLASIDVDQQSACWLPPDERARYGSHLIGGRPSASR